MSLWKFSVMLPFRHLWYSLHLAIFSYTTHDSLTSNVALHTIISESGNSVAYTPKGLAYRLEYSPLMYLASTAFVAGLFVDTVLNVPWGVAADAAQAQVCGVYVCDVYCVFTGCVWRSLMPLCWY